MKTVFQELQELCSLTCQFVQQNYKARESIMVDQKWSEAYRAFRAAPKPQAPQQPTAVSLETKPRSNVVKQERPKPRPHKPKEAPKPVEPQPELLRAPLRSQPVKEAHNDSFTEERAVISKALPQLRIIDQIPSDEHAKKRAARWKNQQKIGEITLLVDESDPEAKGIWLNLVKALSLEFAPTQLLSTQCLEAEFGWERFFSASQLQWILAPSTVINETPSLSKGTHSLPLFELPPASGLRGQATAKTALWNALSKEWAGLTSLQK